LYTFASNFYKTNDLEQTVAKYGTILKREALSNASSWENQKFLILESRDPFPGFYCSEQMPADNSCKEKSYYLPVTTLPCCHQDLVCRISLEVNQKFGIQVCPAHISLQGKYSKAIRVKDMQGHAMDEVAGIFEQNGISFHKHKKIGTYLSHIYLKSFFEIETLEQNIYRNALSPDIFYLTIPQNLDWKPFEQIVTFQKSNNSFKNFDAAIGYWMEKPRFIDFLRIYGKKLSLAQLNEIREKFIEILEYYNKEKVLI
jgi:hypothetical protein